MHSNDARTFTRFQCGNSLPVRFSLLNQRENIKTHYCICTDMSASGARFFADCEFKLNQKLRLTVEINDQQSETLDVTVIRVDTSLSDEERYCTAVKIDQSLALFGQLADLSKQASQSIAA